MTAICAKLTSTTLSTLGRKEGKLAVKEVLHLVVTLQKKNEESERARVVFLYEMRRNLDEVTIVRIKSEQYCRSLPGVVVRVVRNLDLRQNKLSLDGLSPSVRISTPSGDVGRIATSFKEIAA